ncbi:AI-2E family transporter [bacterium]|nr:AI-2E family transporter [bacterium]
MSPYSKKDWSRPVFLLLGFVIVFWIFRELSGLILPLILALFLVMLLQPILTFLIRKKIPNWIAITLISILTLALVSVFVSIISSTVGQVADNSDELVFNFNRKLDFVVEWINAHLSVTLSSYQVKHFITEPFKGDWLGSALGGFAKFLGSITGSFFMFALYFIILLSGISNYEDYIEFVFKDRGGKRFAKEFNNIIHSISSYIGLKFFVSALTGLCFWLICLAFKIEFALFWGFLAFALNFIPSIGSIIATIPPILLGLIYLDSGVAIVIYSLLLVITEVIIGNILDPMLMGNRMKLNTLTVILGLVFWGYIWGVAGMLLSVPLMVLLRIFLEHNEDTIFLARAMSSTKKRKFADTISEE